jgi:hypothetical protein
LGKLKTKKRVSKNLNINIMKKQTTLLLLCFLSFFFKVQSQQVLLFENFESGVLNPLLTVQTVGSFNSNPGIKNNNNFGSTKAFGFGQSTCPMSCFYNYTSSLTITFPTPTLVDSIKWSEMELFDNWGSWGELYVNDILLPGSSMGAQPNNSGTPDPTPRHQAYAVNQIVTTIKFYVVDITNSSEITIDDLIVTSPCDISVVRHPENQSLVYGSNATFISKSSDPLGIYRWQTDLGLGFQNLSNAGQYYGTDDDTLTVFNITYTNNNQLFRCIVSSGPCSDTTNSARLTVTTGINEFNSSGDFNLFPNPFTNELKITLKGEIPSEILIYDITSRLLLKKSFLTSTSLKTDLLTEGIYIYELRNKSGLLMAGKIIKE